MIVLIVEFCALEKPSSDFVSNSSLHFNLLLRHVSSLCVAMPLSVCGEPASLCKVVNVIGDSVWKGDKIFIDPFDSGL